jgi:thioredoxin reductase (NADPH)
MSDHFDVLVIGEGIAGLTAAGLLASRGVRVASFESNMFGGLVLNLTHLKPSPEGAPSSGAEYAANLLTANIDNGVTRFRKKLNR